MGVRWRECAGGWQRRDTASLYPLSSGTGGLCLACGREHAPTCRPPPTHSPRRRTDRWRAKYELLHVVRTHMGQDDAHYG